MNTSEDEPGADSEIGSGIASENKSTDLPDAASEKTPIPEPALADLDFQDVDPASLRVFREPEWMLRLTIGNKVSFPRPKIVRALPLSRPDEYISFLDVKDEEICMVEDLTHLDERSQQVVREELEARYLTAIVARINSVRNEFGTSYWDVETDRGTRDFVVQNVSENARWLDGGNRLLLLDVDGNRFEIPSLTALDKRSQTYIEQVL